MSLIISLDGWFIDSLYGLIRLLTINFPKLPWRKGYFRFVYVCTCSKSESFDDISTFSCKNFVPLSVDQDVFRLPI